jgi:hypothetical protein
MHCIHGVFFPFLWNYYPRSAGIWEIGSHSPDSFTILLDEMRTQNFKGIVMLIANNAINLFRGDCGCGHEATYVIYGD